MLTAMLNQSPMNAENLELENVFIPTENLSLKGILTIPQNAKGIILFVHEPGSDHLCPRDTRVAKELHTNNFATLLFDLFTEDEQLNSTGQFNSALLTARLLAATKWIAQQEKIKNLQLCYFGGAQGVAAALRASNSLGLGLKAVISRGDAPNLSLPIQEKHTSPILLVVGAVQGTSLSGKEKRKTGSTHSEFLINDVESSCEELEALRLIADVSVSWFDLYIRTRDENVALHN